MKQMQKPVQPDERRGGFEVVCAYTRAQAIEDGVLVDVTQTAREAGFVWPVAVTRALWEQYIVPDPRAVGQSEDGRLWDVLWMLRHAADKAGEARVIRYRVIFIMKRIQRRFVELKCVAGPGDSGEPVLTVMLPEED